MGQAGRVLRVKHLSIRKIHLSYHATLCRQAGHALLPLSPLVSASLSSMLTLAFLPVRINCSTSIHVFLQKVIKKLRRREEIVTENMTMLVEKKALPLPSRHRIDALNIEHIFFFCLGCEQRCVDLQAPLHSQAQLTCAFAVRSH